MTSRAEDWGAHDLDRRFDLGPPRDELTGLAATLDGLLDAHRRVAPPRAALRRRDRPRAAHADRRRCAAGPSWRWRRRTRRRRREGRGPARGRRAVGAPDAHRRHAARRRAARARPDRGRGRPRRARARGRRRRGRAPPGDLPLAEGEPDVLRRALAPLVDNARRHARARVTLELSAGARPRPDRRARRRPGPRPRRSASAPSTPACAAPRRPAAAPASGCRSRAASRAPAAATSCSATGPGGCFVLELPGRVGPAQAVRSTQGCLAHTAAHDHHRPRGRRPSLGRKMLNKVPEVTLFFWVIKIMCTTVGETAADYLNDNLGFGLTNTTYVTGALLAVLLLAQFRLRALRPARLLGGRRRHQRLRHADHRQPDRPHNVPLTTSTPIFAVDPRRRLRRLVRGRAHAVDPLDRHHPPRGVLLAGDPLHLRAGHRRRRPASPRSSTSATAVSIAIFGGAIAAVTVAHYALKLNAVLAFWLAYILTRPLGASIGDVMSQNSHKYGGLGLGTTGHELHLPRLHPRARGLPDHHQARPARARVARASFGAHGR